MVMTPFQDLGQKRMNNRIFLYSSLFLVLILLFDASSNNVSQPTASLQPNIPETSSVRNQKNIEPKQDIIKNSRAGSNKNIEVTTDTLKIILV